jgi:hypothetical protein
MTGSTSIVINGSYTDARSPRLAFATSAFSSYGVHAQTFQGLLYEPRLSFGVVPAARLLCNITFFSDPFYYAYDAHMALMTFSIAQAALQVITFDSGKVLTTGASVDLGIVQIGRPTLMPSPLS